MSSLAGYSDFEIIGKGTYGRVFVATDNETQHQVVIKQVDLALLTQEEIDESLREVKLSISPSPSPPPFPFPL